MRGKDGMQEACIYTLMTCLKSERCHIVLGSCRYRTRQSTSMQTIRQRVSYWSGIRWHGIRWQVTTLGLIGSRRRDTTPGLVAATKGSAYLWSGTTDRPIHEGLSTTQGGIEDVSGLYHIQLWGLVPCCQHNIVMCDTVRAKLTEYQNTLNHFMSIS